MAVVSLSEIKKNIWILSNLKWPLKIRDNRKNIDIAVVYPVSNINDKSILNIAGSLRPSKEILKKSKNISFDEIKKEAIDLYVKERACNLWLKNN